ncbi:MAG: aspartyl protease family protein [Chitinivibrionia bacterium]|nr:aspartyl protease family protein [Chitinivibrionia bacterium]
MKKLKKPTVHALTSPFHKGLSRRIVTPVAITNISTKETRFTEGIWDTGATGSVITKSTAAALGLPPIAKMRVRGVHGDRIVNAYYVNITLDNKNITLDARVTECDELSADNTLGMLIGMDIITMGDFVITNYKGDTSMSFRIPSLQKIDFVKGAEQ